MAAEIIAVGTEILTGQIINTNAQFLSEIFAGVGIDVYFHTTVGDNSDRLIQALEIATKRSDMVVLCGGLGPTDDDLTKQTLARFLRRELIIEAGAMKRLDDYYISRPGCLRTSNNDRQVQMVEGFDPLQNPKGLAVGAIGKVTDTTYVVLPGPPTELEAMVFESLLPVLEKKERQLYSRILRFYGIGESQLTTVLADMIDKQTDPTLASYAKSGEVTLRLSTKARSQEEAKLKLNVLEREILSRKTVTGMPLTEFMYGYGDETTLAQVVVERLQEKGLQMTAAESLTGGHLQSMLTEVPGASNVFAGGFVTYSLEAKANMLGISTSQLEEDGVVSAETALAMAKGAIEKTGSDIAVSLTGVAGPGHLEDKEVGTVFIGLVSPNETGVYKLQLGVDSREAICHKSCLAALDKVRRVL